MSGIDDRLDRLEAALDRLEASDAALEAHLAVNPNRDRSAPLDPGRALRLVDRASRRDRTDPEFRAAVTRAVRATETDHDRRYGGPRLMRRELALMVTAVGVALLLAEEQTS